MNWRNSASAIENAASEGGYARKNSDALFPVDDGMAINFSRGTSLNAGWIDGIRSMDGVVGAGG